MDSSTQLLDLPNEIVLYILRQFLDLGDVWGLLQVSRQLRHFAIETIHKRWKIDPIFTPATIMKIQCRAALIALERLSTQLPIQQEQEYYPLAASGYDRISSPQNEFAITTTSTLVHDFDDDNNRNPTDHDDEDEEEDDDSEAMEDLYQAAMTMRSAGLDIGTSIPPQLQPPLTSGTTQSLYSNATSIPESSTTSIKIHEYLLTNIDCGPDDTTTTSISNDLNPILLQEKQLHQRIICGINACKHKYVLIEDIDIRNRIRATVDVIFHHTVFVSAIARQDQLINNNNTNLAVMMVRLLIRLDTAFPSYCREITYTLVDHIKAFLEYTGYKLLGQRSGCLHGRDFRLHSLVSNGITEAPSTSMSSATLTTSLLPISSTTSSLSLSTTIPNRYNKISSIATTTTTTTSTTSILPSSLSLSSRHIHSSSPACSLPPTLYSMAACFDLMGAAFIGKMIGETHIECAVQRVCELLTDDARHVLGQTKKTLLVDLLEGWLTCKRGLMTTDLCRFVQSEIDKC